MVAVRVSAMRTRPWPSRTRFQDTLNRVMGWYPFLGTSRNPIGHILNSRVGFWLLPVQAPSPMVATTLLSSTCRLLLALVRLTGVRLEASRMGLDLELRLADMVAVVEISRAPATTSRLCLRPRWPTCSSSPSPALLSRSFLI